MGYRINQWAAVWLNGELKRYATGVVDDSDDPYGSIIQIGKTNSTENTPSGALRFDDFAFQVPPVNDLWVDAFHGNDANNGLTSGVAFRKAAATPLIEGVISVLEEE